MGTSSGATALVSGVFISTDHIPTAMQRIHDLFPVKRLFEAVVTAFDPSTSGARFAWGDPAVVAARRVAGSVVAAKRSRWAPRCR